MKVSLIATVKDAGSAIHPFLASLAAQTRPPDEVLIVDGGSTDGTMEALRAAAITVISEPGAGIARGRNIGIAAATHDLIAVTDADCVLARDWLERLLRPFDVGADVVAGFYRPLAGSFVQECLAATNMPEWRSDGRRSRRRAATPSGCRSARTCV